MTMPAHSIEVGSRLPSADEKAAANHLREIIAASMEDDTVLRFLDDKREPTQITLTPGLSKLLLALLRHISNGNAVTLVPVGQQLTTQQAADILNVSRPFLIKLLEEGEIQYEKVGRHRRIKAEDLFAYKAERDGVRSQALEQLASLDAQLI